jgi:hypothetical protein
MNQGHVWYCHSVPNSFCEDTNFMHSYRKQEVGQEVMKRKTTKDVPQDDRQQQIRQQITYRRNLRTKKASNVGAMNPLTDRDLRESRTLS